MKFLKNIFFSLLIIPIMTFAMSGQEIESSINKCISEGHTHGMVIGIIKEDGTTFYKGGTLGVNDKRPIDENTVFETGSITKIFTSFLLATMAKEGEVKLDDPMQKYLPSYVKVPTFNGTKITLDHLSKHTAGFAYVPENFLMSDPYNPWCEYTVDYIYDMINNTKLPYEPGTQYQYSNISIGLLGHVLSLQANNEYEDLIYDKILKNLDMQDTKFHLTDELRSRFADAHIRDKQVPHWEIKEFFGAGGLHSTAKDLARFVEANMGFYKSDIKDLLDESLKNRAPQDIPFLDVGLEWNLSYKYKPEIIYHGGITGGHQVFIGFCKETKTGVVITSNSAANISDIGKNILNDNWYLNEYRQQATLVPMFLLQFVGNYESDNRDSVSIEFEPAGHLSTLLFKKGFYPALRLYPSSDNSFFVKAVDLNLTFIRDEKNNIIGMDVFYNGSKQFLKKMN